jgi:hypothetical protein
MSSKQFTRSPSVGSSSSSDSDTRSRTGSNATGVVLVTAPLDAGKFIHYFYLDGGTISVFYGQDIVAYLEAKELQSAEKISKFLGDSGQLETVEFPLYFPDGRTSIAEKHIFVTVDGFIRLGCMFGSIDKQRRILWCMRHFVEGTVDENVFSTLFAIYFFNWREDLSLLRQSCFWHTKKTQVSGVVFLDQSFRTILFSSLN